MTNFENLLAAHDGSAAAYGQWQRAQELFEDRRYTDAVAELQALLESERGRSTNGGLRDVELLLARAYFHSAQLGRAEAAARAIIEIDPDDAYARLLLARTLQRAGRSTEAAGHARVADALGA
ncbi:tetratricopeptide repeat protein [Dermacoccaceae bacterium W4C1]